MEFDDQCQPNEDGINLNDSQKVLLGSESPLKPNIKNFEISDGKPAGN
jgi:hypothetical protein